MTDTRPDDEVMKPQSEIALEALAADDARMAKLHDLLENIREQIRLGVAPEHRPDGLFQNVQDAVYAMRGRVHLLNDAAITAALRPAPASGMEDYILVPREPTVEMLVAAQEEWLCVRAAEERGDFIWRAMLAAAPAQPSPAAIKREAFEEAAKVADRYPAMPKATRQQIYREAKLLDEWHEDFGEKLWWFFPVREAPYVGSPLSDDWPGHHTHWTDIVVPAPPALAPKED